MPKELAADAPPQDPKFTQVAEDIKRLKKELGNDQKLELYGLYKQSTAGPSEFENTKKPGFGMGMLPAGQMYYAWEKVVKSGLTAEQAQAKYIEVAQKHIDEYGLKD